METYNTTESFCKCCFCDKEHEMNKYKFPAFGKKCFKYKEKNISSQWANKKKTIEMEKIDPLTRNVEIYDIKAWDKSRERVK